MSPGHILTYPSYSLFLFIPLDTYVPLPRYVSFQNHGIVVLQQHFIFNVFRKRVAFIETLLFLNYYGKNVLSIVLHKFTAIWRNWQYFKIRANPKIWLLAKLLWRDLLESLGIVAEGSESVASLEESTLRAQEKDWYSDAWRKTRVQEIEFLLVVYTTASFSITILKTRN